MAALLAVRTAASAPHQPSTRRGRRVTVLALLSVAALVAVLAVTALRGEWTLATWLDHERATAHFATGTFQSQSQAAGGTDWATHPTGAPVVLAADGLAGLAPGGDHASPAAGEARYLWLNLRTAPGSDWSGHAKVTASTASGALAPALEYRIVQRASASTEACTADDLASGTPVIGDATTWQAADQPVTTSARVAIGADGTDPAGLCVAVRVGAGAAGSAGSGYQGTTADLGWTVTVTQDASTA